MDAATVHSDRLITEMQNPNADVWLSQVGVCVFASFKLSMPWCFAKFIED